MMDDNKIGRTFAERLRLLREEEGVNQTQLAEALKVSRGAVSYYERAERMPDITFAASAANYFKVSTDYLLGLTDDPKPKPSAVDELGLSNGAVKRIRYIKGNSELNDYIGICDAILSSSLFEKIVYDLRCLVSASIADDIYYRSLARFRQRSPEESELDYFERSFVDKEMFYHKMGDIADDMQYSANSHVAGYLRYMVKLEQANEDALNSFDTFTIDGIGPEVVCPALRTGINEYFDALVKETIAAEKRKFYNQQSQE